MRNQLYFIIVCLFLIGCENVERSPEPDPFFGKEKMSDILTDMYLIEGSQNSNRRSFLKTSIRPDSFLYKKYKMDSLSYTQNFNYYADRIEVYEELLEMTEVKLQKLEDSIVEAEEKRDKKTKNQDKLPIPKDRDSVFIKKRELKRD